MGLGLKNENQTAKSHINKTHFRNLIL